MQDRPVLRAQTHERQGFPRHAYRRRCARLVLVTGLCRATVRSAKWACGPVGTRPQPATRPPARVGAVDSYALGEFSVSRIGFGAMQLPGPGVWGPPRDRGEALQVLRR